MKTERRGLFRSRTCEPYGRAGRGGAGASLPPPAASGSPPAREGSGARARTQGVGGAPLPGDALRLVSALMRRLAARGAAGYAGVVAAPAVDSTDCDQGRNRALGGR